jgi:bloom syndrome protein
MQLRFFGERFDRAKCGNTCDNCRAGRTPEARDVTKEVKDILQLLIDLQQQKRNGVTLNQLTEIYRGTKTQSVIKFINTGQLNGYGAGKAFKKHEIDRIAHSMIFERVITETSVQNQQGFASDYVQMGENAAAIQMGQKSFTVDFPRDPPRSSTGTSTGKENKVTKSDNRKKKAKSSSPKKKLPTGARKKPAAVKSNTLSNDTIIAIDSSSEEEEEFDPAAIAAGTSSSGGTANSLLPRVHFENLKQRLHTVVQHWVEEERMCGNHVHVWHIMSYPTMKAVASQVPTTLDELKGLGILGEEIIKNYGERIVKIVTTFVEQSGLEKYIHERPAKRAKTDASDKVLVDEDTTDDDDDEFSNGLDLSTVNVDVVVGNGTSSKFFAS